MLESIDKKVLILGRRDTPPGVCTYARHIDYMGGLNQCYDNFYKINSSPPGQNGRHFADDIFRCILVNEKFCILIKILLKFVPKGPTDDNPVLI